MGKKIVDFITTAFSIPGWIIFLVGCALLCIVFRVRDAFGLED